MDRETQPAILGGSPVRAAGFPAWPPNDPEIAEALESAFGDGSWGRYHGPHTTGLVEALAEFHQCEHVVLCSSGTAAVELALRGLQVGPSDGVLLGAYDFKGNFQDVLAVGARPQLVDVRRENCTVDVEQLAGACTASTKAVLVSHLHGGVAALPKIQSVADERGIPVIEDACQMPGAFVAGRRAGLWGRAGTLSFGGSKLLTAGRGGAVLTNDAALVQRIRLYTQRGNEAYPLSELQAAVLLPQLKRLDARNAQRAECVRILTTRLPSDSGLLAFTNPEEVIPGSETLPAYYKLGFWYDPACWSGLTRDSFVKAMRAEGIPIDVGFRALHLIHGRRRFEVRSQLECAARADEQVLVLHHPLLLEGQQGADDFLDAAAKIKREAPRIQKACEAAPASPPGVGRPGEMA